jgi:hypothetical protein
MAQAQSAVRRVCPLRLRRDPARLHDMDRGYGTLQGGLAAARQAGCMAGEFAL